MEARPARGLQFTTPFFPSGVHMVGNWKSEMNLKLLADLVALMLTFYQLIYPPPNHGLRPLTLTLHLSILTL